MNFELAYTVLNFAVVPAWALLILAPRAGITRKAVHSGLYPLVFGLIYIGFLSSALFFGQSAEGGNMTTLGGVMTLFSHPVGLLTGWTHYLVFDLFVGAWEGRDAQRRDLPHWILVLSLPFTFLFGPVGLFLYLVLRWMRGVPPTEL